MKQFLKRYKKTKITSMVLLTLILLLALVIRLRYGGGQPYPDISGQPEIPASALEIAITLEEPPGNVAVSQDGRIFFTIHPESRPDTIRLGEWKNNKAVPYPNEKYQNIFFDTVLGLFIDRQNRLWSIDHGSHGMGTPRLLAFDLATGEIVHEYLFFPDIAQWGSFLQDLQVDAEGKTIYIADASIIRKNPAVVVYDIESKTARRVLESHPSVYPQDWMIRTPVRRMTFLAGLFTMKVGIDGIVLDNKGEYLYYGAMNHDTLYRAAVKDLKDTGLSPQSLGERVEEVGRKPLSDGLSMDLQGNIYITDVEHGAVMKMDAERNLRTLVKDPRIRWADGFSFGPGGWLYLADSAIPNITLRSKSHIKYMGPYYIFRFQPGQPGMPGR
jgi:sugar lactone lactonase YvrE